LSLSFDHITDDLLVKHLLGEANQEEKQFVEEWISADDGNNNYYQGLKAVWEESKKLAVGSHVDEEAAWTRFKLKISEPKRAGVLKRLDLSWISAAAVFLVVVGIAYLAYSFLHGKPVQTLVVASGTRALTDTLPDGSIVTLNRNSELDYPSRFKGSERPVVLKGEAFFNVTPNKKKPFIIHVNDVTIRVVGTSFNVRSLNGITEVIVETGVVQVIHHNKTIELRKDEKIRVLQHDSTLIKENVQDRLYNYYRSREFVCDNTPLWKFVEILNEAYGANIIIENPKLRGLLLTAPFENESLDRILEVVHETFNITVIKETDRIILR